VKDGRETVSIMQASVIVGVARRTMCRWIETGKVEYLRTAGGSIRIFKDTLFRPTGPRSSTTRAEVGATLPRADVNGQAPPDSRKPHG
jgi:excisionase family DNA binding protein